MLAPFALVAPLFEAAFFAFEGFAAVALVFAAEDFAGCLAVFGLAFDFGFAAVLAFATGLAFDGGLAFFAGFTSDLAFDLGFAKSDSSSSNASPESTARFCMLGSESRQPV